MGDNSPSVERVIIGAGHTLLAGWFLVLYLAVLFVISMNKNLRILSSYKLMMVTGVLHCTPLVVETVTGVILTFDINISETLLEQIIGAVSSVSYKCSVFMNLILAINRFQILCFLSNTGRATFVLACLAISAIIYLVVVSYLLYRKRSHPQAGRPSTLETRMLIQCILLNGFNALAIFCYNYGIQYVPNRYDGVVSNTTYITINGINSVLYVFFVKAIRSGFMGILVRSRSSVNVHRIPAQGVNCNGPSRPALGLAQEPDKVSVHGGKNTSLTTNT
uniref:7TM_GPCR_Srx domain-containing protein n=1 Tax=Steinernema glaseri TaxID=37863 RepID=A0A1I7YLP8_9BILA